MTDLTRRDFVGASLALMALPGLAQENDGFEVHEWGVLTVAEGATWAAARTGGVTFDAKRAEIAANPPEFAMTWTKFIGDRIETWKTEPRVVFKPVIYFHAKKPLTVRLKIGVPRGRPAIWWPPASEVAPTITLPVHSGRLDTEQEEPPKIESIVPEKGHLLWNDLFINPGAEGLAFRKVDAAHWWHAARQVDSAGVLASQESERFVYYDALTIVDSPIETSWTDDSVSVKNLLAREIPFLVAIRVKDGKALTAVSGALAAGATAKLPLKAGEASALTDHLKTAGLTAKEAAGMTAIWTPEFFTADGFRVLAPLPAAEIERLLPMEITPAPAKLVRVLLVHVECPGPAGTRDIDALIAKLGSDDVAERDEAAVKLSKLGLRAEGALRKAAKAATDAEVRARIAELLKSIGVKP